MTKKVRLAYLSLSRRTCHLDLTGRFIPPPYHCGDQSSDDYDSIVFSVSFAFRLARRPKRQSRRQMARCFLWRFARFAYVQDDLPYAVRRVSTAQKLFAFIPVDTSCCTRCQHERRSCGHLPGRSPHRSLMSICRPASVMARQNRDHLSHPNIPVSVIIYPQQFPT